MGDNAIGIVGVIKKKEITSMQETRYRELVANHARPFAETGPSYGRHLLSLDIWSLDQSVDLSLLLACCWTRAEVVKSRQSLQSPHHATPRGIPLALVTEPREGGR